MSGRFPVYLGVLAVLCVGLVSCGRQAAENSEPEDKEKQLAELQEQVAQLEKEIADAKDPAAASAPAPQQPGGTNPRPAPPASNAGPRDSGPAETPPARSAPAETRRATVTIPAGTRLVVRTTTEISTKRVQTGDIFAANLEERLVVDGRVVAARGAKVTGRIANADSGGRVKGRAELEVGVHSLVTSGGQTVNVDTDTVAVTAEGSKKKDALKVGIATGIGAAIGAIAGGGKGAAIGAGAGAGAGTGAVLLTRGDAAVLPAESVLDFTLAAPVTIGN